VNEAVAQTQEVDAATHFPVIVPVIAEELVGLQMHA
jgi:hypothetical protein